MDLDKKGYQDVGDAVGMPDADDKRRLEAIIRKYEKNNPGEIAFHRDTAKARMDNEFAVVDKSSNRRYLFELPPKLHADIEAYIPTIFRSKKHFAWFCKNFPKLRIAARY